MIDIEHLIEKCLVFIFCLFFVMNLYTRDGIVGFINLMLNFFKKIINK
jgi:hypothetical protein